MTEHGYPHYTQGCRCDVCKAAKVAYMRERRRAARALARKHTTDLRGVANGSHPTWPVGTERHYVSDVKHATSYAYFERGCRCPDCTAWHSADNMARAKRRKDGAA